MVLVLAMTGSLVACGSPDKVAEAPPASASSETRYDLKGKVVSVDKSHSSVTVNHEEIKGFMSAMTMGYTVKDAKALDALAPGDVMTAKLVSSGNAYWLEDVKVVEHATGDRR
jgi:protein SCO1/2